MVFSLGTVVDTVQPLGIRKTPSGIVDLYFRTNTDGVVSDLFDTIETFETGSDELGVFRNGMKLVLSSTLSEIIDRYDEADDQTIDLEVSTIADDVMTAINDPKTSAVLQSDGLAGTVLTVPSYVLGQNQLLVFRNGVLMVNSLTVGDAVDQYQETTTTTITLQSASVAADTFRTEVIASPVFLEEVDGESGLAIPTTNTISAADAKLNVFRNGILMQESGTLGDPVDRYIVSGANEITLETAAVASDRFTFLKRS
jgi:hypothetical protein